MFLLQNLTYSSAALLQACLVKVSKVKQWNNNNNCCIILPVKFYKTQESCWYSRREHTMPQRLTENMYSVTVSKKRQWNYLLSIHLSAQATTASSNCLRVGMQSLIWQRHCFPWWHHYETADLWHLTAATLWIFLFLAHHPGRRLTERNFAQWVTFNLRLSPPHSSRLLCSHSDTPESSSVGSQGREENLPCSFHPAVSAPKLISAVILRFGDTKENVRKLLTSDRRRR